MTGGGLAVVALAVAAVLFVALPLLRTPSRDDALPEVSARERERIELRERRDAAYDSLRELELDRAAGKLTDPDYALTRESLRREAIESLRALELLDAGSADAVDVGQLGEAPVEREAVADVQLVGDREAAVANREAADQPPGRPVE